MRRARGGPSTRRHADPRHSWVLRSTTATALAGVLLASACLRESPRAYLPLHPTQAVAPAQAAHYRDALLVRLTSLGANNPAVEASGPSLLLSASGNDGAVLAAAARPGRVELRPVIASRPAHSAGTGSPTTVPAVPVATGSPATGADPLAALDCTLTAATGPADPQESQVACGEDGERLLLGPAVLTGDDVVFATPTTMGAASPGPAAASAVAVTFTNPAMAVLHDLTAAMVGQRLSVVLDGRAVTTPVVTGPLGEPAVLTGHFTAQQADSLAARITVAALPYSPGAVSTARPS